MHDLTARLRTRTGFTLQLMALFAMVFATSAQAGTINVEVVDPDGNLLGNGVRWILEEDVTYDIDPANPPANPLDSAYFQMHKSYMPVVTSGTEGSAGFSIPDVDESKRYYLSVIPNLGTSDCGSGGTTNCYTMSGAPVQFDGGATSVSTRVVVAPQPLPAAQARILVFDDRGLINNAPDANEEGLGDFTIFISDHYGGPLVTDLYGNPLGTTYHPNGDIDVIGDGTFRTLNADEVNDPAKNPHGLKVGEALIQNIAPGKYGIQVVPPAGSNWQQTTTIEGSQVIDAWLRAGEPRFVVEFGGALTHAFYGFVREFDDLPAGSNSITGTVKNLRFPRPPGQFSTGEELGNCWVGLNDATTQVGLYAAPCNKYGEGEASFEIRNVPDGTYGVVVWDRYMLTIISFFTAVVNGGDVQMNDVPVPKWFGIHEHYVFNDLNGNGLKDDGEPGLPEQAINLRFRDGSIYAASATDLDGYLPLEEVFPFFSYLVAEVDFARFKATGVTITVDDGGQIPDLASPVDPSDGLRNPQIQAEGNNQRYETTTAGACAGISDCEEVDAPPLTEAVNTFATMNHKFEWAKTNYPAGENGGISGGVYYQVTRAENDPRFAAPEEWEPGIPRVQVALYRADADGNIQDTNGVAGIQLTDIDNYPFGWSEGGTMGPEDVDRLPLGPTFSMGDAIEVTHTDSFDDNVPDGCLNDDIATDGRCYDGLRNWTQIRPGVFDGGYGLGAPWSDLVLEPGPYVVEAMTPPGYEHQDELSKNVDFGDDFIPQALPPVCVGDPDHTGGAQDWNVVPAGAELDLFGGVQVDARYEGNRPFCSFKHVFVTDAKNTAADFFMYTDVPVSGHIQGNVTNDVGNEFRPDSPNFGEKIAAANIPISIRDHLDNEINRLYTDEYGRYNGLVPSTYRINVPMASGVSPNMARVCLNPSTKPDPNNLGQFIPEPFHNPAYSQSCRTFNFSPGQTTYLDTPVLPIGAFVGTQAWQLDCNYPSGTPVISWVTSDAASGGPIADAAAATVLTINSAGQVMVEDPLQDSPAKVARDFGFGAAQGAGQVLLNGVPLTVNSWTADVITAVVPVGATTGQLEIVRDNGMRTAHGLTVIVTDPGAVIVADGVATSIQQAIDAAAPGDVVLVEPGTYFESVIVTKPIQLQGYGAGATIINAGRGGKPSNLVRWQEEANRRVNCPANPLDQIGLLPGQDNNSRNPADPASCNDYVPGTGLLITEEVAGVFVAPQPGVFGAADARIDGFTIGGTDFSGGIIVNGYTNGLKISNNVVTNNQGVSAGGIRVGAADLYGENGDPIDADNINLEIHNNYIASNSSVQYHGGGIGLYNGSDNYSVASNYICGNFTQGNGAGIAHFGRSPNGEIRDNQILFNQSFDQTAQGTGGSGGGIMIAGQQQDAGAPLQLTAGTGSVKIVGNRLQGNIAGSADGGGIALRSVNGQDLLVSQPENRDSIEILNNMISNNISGLAAGGISLQDAVNVAIINNTIVNNDSTATAAAALVAGNPNLTENQPAGVVSRVHSTALEGIRTQVGGISRFSRPLLDNNIIMGNRSMHWEAPLPSDPVGSGVVYDRIWDLAVLGIARELDPRRSILTQGSGSGNGVYATTGPDRNFLVPMADQDALLDTPYFNGNSASEAAHSLTTPVLAFPALDEGGNFLNVTFGPLTPVGDYHIEAGSLAVDIGRIRFTRGFADLRSDYDGDPRPVYAGITLQPDIGADELPAVDPGTPVAPRIISLAPRASQVGQLYSYQVLAVDANPGDDAGFSWQVRRCANPNQGWANCNRNLGTATIDANGLFTLTPGNGSPRHYQVRVSDPGGLNDTQQFTVDPYNSQAPTANDDPDGNGFININVPGQFMFPAPGVLANDATGNNNQNESLTAMLDTGPATGEVTVAANGAFFFTPPDGWVGTSSFTYQVSDGVHPATDTALVRVRKRVAVTNATFTDEAGTANDSWNVSGNSIPGTNGRVFVELVPAAGGAVTLIGRTAPGDLNDGTWSVSATGVSMNAGDTIRIRRSGNNIWLQNVIPQVLFAGLNDAGTTVFYQCPGDDNGDGIYDAAEQAAHPDIWCQHLAAGDGFIRLPDERELYIFGFSDVSDQTPETALDKGLLNAQFPAPSLVFDEGQEAYLTLTNVGTIMRPDLFDPHTVHFHGFPNASAVFDGVPESSISINAGFSLTYYYNITTPGTFMYHCHVEAAEHMQMGMLGNLYVKPAQNNAPPANSNCAGGSQCTQFVYNDGDGSTGYDVEVPIQIGSMDSFYHDEHLLVQPLPFADMRDDYPMLNGRGYPHTTSVADIAPLPGGDKANSDVISAAESSQKINSVIEVQQGQKLLLRISNLNVTQISTLTASGLTMRVVGQGAHIMRGPGGADLYYDTTSVTLGGGNGIDVIIDTTGIAPGTYPLYTSNLYNLSNGNEDFGGMMTEIVITP